MIIINPEKIKFDEGELIKFSGTVMPNIPLELILEDICMVMKQSFIPILEQMKVKAITHMIYQGLDIIFTKIMLF